MTRRPRAAFVLTVSLLGAAACEKKPAARGGECLPPDCHMNPPPQELTPKPPATASAASSAPVASPEAGASAPLAK